MKIGPKKNNNGQNKYHAFRWSTKKVQEESHDLAFVESVSGWKVYTKVRDVESTALKDIIMDIATNDGSTDIANVGIDQNWFDYPNPVAGVFTSTEVKLGPGGYLTVALERMAESDRGVISTELPVLWDKRPDLDELEQFQHHYHPHEEYVREFAQRDLFFQTKR